MGSRAWTGFGWGGLGAGNRWSPCQFGVSLPLLFPGEQGRPRAGFWARLSDAPRDGWTHVPRENLSPLPANSVFRASTNFSRIFSFCRRGGSRLRLRGLPCARPCAGHTTGGSSEPPRGYCDLHLTDEETEAQGTAVPCSRSSSPSGRARA